MTTGNYQSEKLTLASKNLEGHSCKMDRLNIVGDTLREAVDCIIFFFVPLVHIGTMYLRVVLRLRKSDQVVRNNKEISGCTKYRVSKVLSWHFTMLHTLIKRIG